jgi:hypothetical protein
MANPDSVFRITHFLPPVHPDDYITFAQRRDVSGLDAEARKAAQGLSVYTTLDSAVATARKFPQLGNFIVRYNILEECSLIIEHRIGISEHFTVFGDTEEFHAFYDQSWSFDLNDIRT